jgi:superfamily I DNA and RNA helicase
MDNKKIIFWLHRVLSEKCSDINKLQSRIGILNHQAQNYNQMNEIYQKEVLKDLVIDLMDYNWQDAITELETPSQAASVLEQHEKDCPNCKVTNPKSQSSPIVLECQPKLMRDGVYVLDNLDKFNREFLCELYKKIGKMI